MPRRLLLYTAAGALVLGGPVFAQDFKQGAPKELPAERPTIETPPPPTAEEDPSPVSENLRGLIFVPGSKFLGGYKAKLTEGVDIVRLEPGEDGVDLDVIDNRDFRAMAQGMMGKPVSLGDLQRFARDVVDYYRAKGHPLVDVRIPAAQLDPRKTGVVLVTVSEFRVGAIDVRGVQLVAGKPTLTPSPKYFDPDKIREGMRIERGSRIEQQRLIEDLNFLSSNPFRRVDLIYRKADEVGYTDLTLRVAERRPFRAYVGYENTGTPLTQRDRFSVGLNWGNVFGLDQQFSYQFTGSQNLLGSRPGNPKPSFVSHSFTYLAPINSSLPFHDSLLIFGTYQRASPVLNPFISQVGKNYQFSARYIVQLPASEDSKHQLSLGYDFKETNNDLLFGGTSISNAVTDAHQAVIEYSGEASWRVGGVEGRSEAAQSSGTRITLRVGDTVVLSPGNVSGRNSTAALRAGTNSTFVNSQYAYNRLTVSPSVLFENGIEARGRLMWQIASGNLLPTEQLAAAGPSFVRGYDPSSVIGTNGLLLSAELLTPGFTLYPQTGKYRARGQIGAFVDYGMVSDPDRLVTAPARVTTNSVGLTASYGIGNYLSARFDYGFQLKRLPGATATGELGYLSVTLGF